MCRSRELSVAPQYSSLLRMFGQNLQTLFRWGLLNSCFARYTRFSFGIRSSSLLGMSVKIDVSVDRRVALSCLSPILSTLVDTVKDMTGSFPKNTSTLKNKGFKVNVVHFLVGTGVFGNLCCLAKCSSMKWIFCRMFADMQYDSAAGDTTLKSIATV